MTNTIIPENSDQVLEVVQWALGDKTQLDVRGQGSKLGLGRSTQADHILDISGLSGITDYQPSELFITANAGTPLKDIYAALNEQNQQLMFEPPDYGPLLDGMSGQGTLGGLVACNIAGPRRVKAGSARDSCIGFHAVSGRGELFKSGGKVVKNVTGFDLSKLITGSYGTLAVMTEATLKVLPSTENTRTVLVCWANGGSSDELSNQAMKEALVSTNEVSGAAHLPAKIAVRSDVGYVSSMGCAVTAVRVEGPAPSTAYRCSELKALLSKFGDVEELHTKNSKTLWKEIADVSYMAVNQNSAVWRLSVPPTEGTNVVRRITENCEADVIYDWAGGLVWLQVNETDYASQDHVRQSVAEVGGHATLVRASDELRATANVFQPLDSYMAGITKRVKEGFDPKGILNPGRMYKGI
jgi:glycolate oxidase FAD binding subunit